MIKKKKSHCSVKSIGRNAGTCGQGQVSSLFCLPGCQRAAWLGRSAGRAAWLRLILSATGREWSEHEPTNYRPAASHSGCQPLARWAAFHLCSRSHTAINLGHWLHLCWCVSNTLRHRLRESDILCVLSLGISLFKKLNFWNSFVNGHFSWMCLHKLEKML